MYQHMCCASQEEIPNWHVSLVRAHLAAATFQHRLKRGADGQHCIGSVQHRRVGKHLPPPSSALEILQARLIHREHGKAVKEAAAHGT
jgi:hypothetical protein